ncbi:MAG: FkbM family methyltransferase [Rhodospirillaceae bacterium]|jgi:FkbM family methyltransferase|nr:FkbM family methyltransferase [Rhodospirillaceae bacterium]MBT3885950.1 FkbM family methyltransferase [Rhodospirillaceae bacterium]MBT4115916.1 FkbM family methyltransferase [Rhodospirillaceae bacterium]MBT4674065.1 FkbM family methyltransferase [Rhodospirillaceae bacterium]MBT5178739.1 FkbM family methyltransferase [Rhodospirillaceae bacterium]
MSSTVSRLLITGARALTWPMKSYRRANTLAQVSEGLVQHLSMPVPGGNIKFESRTARSLHDANSITHGEPETVAWINDLPEASMLWDIGANIGVYSLYAAFVRNIRVAAFEPSAASHAALCRNIEINSLGEMIQPFCLALSDVSGVDYLYMANTDAGHSMHAFAQNTSTEGTIETQFKQSVIGYSIDDFLAAFDVPAPDYVKLDVDSIETKIIAGARNTLTGHVKSILVEADQPAERSGDSEIIKLLDGMGFQMRPGAGDARNYIFDKMP